MVYNVVAVPYPGRGHVNPMMNLCKQLVASSPHVLITFVLTEEWLGFIGSDEKPPSIRFATIPNVLPLEGERAADMPKFVGATQTKMEEPFERLIDALKVPISLIIADTFLYWAVDFGNRRNIPVASLWSMPASVFSVFYHFDLLVRNGDHPLDLSVGENGKKRISYIPGISSIRREDIPGIIYRKDDRLLRLALQVFTKVSKAQYLLFTSIHELEPDVIHALKQEFHFPIYALGPTIPYSDLKHNDQTDHYFNWLNSQPEASVLYVSLGSFLSVSAAQMDEIARGLRQSGVRFLWVARGEATRLQEKCGDTGRVVAWCQQLKVLRHAAIGGFWSHCGWNSIMESIYSGVPIIAFPLMMDQMTIRKHIVEDWKIGLDAKSDVVDNNLVKSKEIAEMVKRFMDVENEGRKQMVKRATELRKETLRAVSEGGSSVVNLSSFLNDIMSFN